MLYYILHSYMDAHLNVCMLYQTSLVTEYLITHINIRALTSMYALMCYQMALLTECLITHITNIRALTSMYALMSYQMPLSTE